MARIKGGVTTRKRRKKILKLAEGYFGSKHALYRTAHEQVMHSLMFAYRDRRQTKRNFRRLWIARINAAAVANEFKYSKLIHGLSLANVQLNRKVLSDIAITEPAVFTSYVELAKDAIANPSKYSQKKTEKVAVVAEAKVEVKEVVKKETPKKEVVKPAPQVVKQTAPVTEKEVKQAELGLSSILATALRDTAIFEGVENARTAKKAELIKALAKLGYKPAVAELPLEDLLFTQLKDMAKELNIEGYTSLKKVELIKAIKKAQK